MEQVLEIKTKFSKGDKLFALKDSGATEPPCLIPVSVNRVSKIKILGEESRIITYSVSSIKHGRSLEVNEIDLYSLDEIERFLK